MWSRGIDNALDIAIDWIVDNAPGLLCDESVAEEYSAAIAEGLTEDAAHERATMDTTCGGNAGHYVPSWEWGILAENPSRVELLSMMGRPAWAPKRAA